MIGKRRNVLRLLFGDRCGASLNSRANWKREAASARALSSEEIQMAANVKSS
jgi:hypothetical protein